MQLARVVFAGALLFGVGCELPEEGDLATDERVDQDGLDDSMEYATEGLDDAIETTDYAIDETMAPSGDVSEAVSEGIIDDEEESNLLSDEDLLGSKKKWKCTYCYKKHGDKECYHGKHKKKNKAKKKAEDKCEDEHNKGCKFYECEKSD